jgi:ligand-binding SRPBCC domain-containing protein
MVKTENIVDENSTIVLDDVIKYKTKLDKLYGYLAKKQINYQILPMEEGDGIIVI